MKKVFSFLIVFVMMFSLTACNADDGMITEKNGTRADTRNNLSSDVDSLLGLTSDTDSILDRNNAANRATDNADRNNSNNSRGTTSDTSSR